MRKNNFLHIKGTPGYQIKLGLIIGNWKDIDTGGI